MVESVGIAFEGGDAGRKYMKTSVEFISLFSGNTAGTVELAL